MGLSRAFRRHESEQRDGTMWTLPGGYGMSTTSPLGTYGSLEQALRNSASWACINVLADSIGRTPVDVFRGAGNVRKPVEPSPMLVSDPSGVVQPDVWRFQLGWSLATDGNAFGRITSTDRSGWPTTIELLDPCCLTDRKVVNGVPQAKYDNREVVKLYPFGDIWHVPGRTVPAGSPFGLSPVVYASSVIGTSLAAESFSLSYFNDGGHPSSLIYSSKDISVEQARSIKDAFRRATQGSREPAVFGADLKYEKIQSDPGETQFIDLIRVMVDQVCRFWGVPPSMVYGSISGQSITYANVTDYDLAFLKHSLDGYYVRIENALTDLLPRPQIAKANRNAILRATPKDRAAVNAQRLANREVTVNELRALEDLPGFGKEFDVPGIPPFAGAAPVPFQGGAA